MKLDRPGASHKEPLAPDDWTMEMSSEGHQFVAQLNRAQTLMCRLSIVAVGQNEAEARTELAEKARAWIADYLSRQHSEPPALGTCDVSDADRFRRNISRSQVFSLLP